MPEPGRSARWATSQPSRCSGDIERSTPSRSESRARPPRTVSTGAPAHAQLLLDVVHHAGVGRGRRREDGRVVGKPVEQVADAAVVGPEVVAPVADAVRLVDDQQPAAARQVGQLLVAEPRVVEPLGTDQEHVDAVVGQRRADVVPLLGVAGVHRHGADARAAGGGDLVAHQRQQRADDHRRAGALGPPQRRGHEVDRRLAPAGALHHQHPVPVGHQRGDRLELAVPELGVGAPDQAAQRVSGPLGEVTRRGAAGPVERRGLRGGGRRCRCRHHRPP